MSGAAQVTTHSYSRFLPALALNYDFSFFPVKVDPLNLKLANQAKNTPVALPSFPIKFLGVWVYIGDHSRTYKQTNKDS